MDLPVGRAVQGCAVTSESERSRARPSSAFIRVDPRTMCLFLASLAVAAMPAFAQLRPSQPETPSGWIPKKLAHAKRYMVAAAHPLAARAGLAMLERGGNAIDAMVATQLVLNLVEPT